MFRESNYNFLINIGSYKLKFIILRVLSVTLVAIAMLRISALIAGDNMLNEHHQLVSYVIISVAFNSVIELNLLAMRVIDHSVRFRWNLYFRGITILMITILLIALWVKIVEEIFTEKNVLSHQVTQITLIIGFLIIVINLLINIISKLTLEWINNRKEISELKQAKLLSDYNSLKDRLNPHFLFNNLSVLKSLIHYKPDDAEIFTQNFTNVYRYVLNSHEETTVMLSEEMKFLASYIALHKERIGEGLNVNIDIDKENLQKRIPPLSIQLLVENAIKHNVAGKNKPLSIEIISKDNYIHVKNNLSPKDTTYSTATGLKTLQAQYKFISNKSITISQNENYFEVKIPLL